MASRDEIRRWLAQGATHLIVMVDPVEHRHFPVVVKEGEAVKDVFARYAAKDQWPLEVYSYALNLDEQLAESRPFHVEGVSVEAHDAPPTSSTATVDVDS